MNLLLNACINLLNIYSILRVCCKLHFHFFTEFILNLINSVKPFKLLREIEPFVAYI